MGALIGSILLGMKADNSNLTKGLLKGGKSIKEFGGDAKSGAGDVQNFSAQSAAALESLLAVVGVFAKAMSHLLEAMPAGNDGQGMSAIAQKLRGDIDDLVGSYHQMKKAAEVANDEAKEKLREQAEAAAKAARTISARMERAWHGIRGGINSVGSAMMSFKGLMAGAFAAAGAGMLVDKFKETAVAAAENIRQQDLLAKRLGTNVTQVSTLEFAYKKAMGTDEVEGFRDALSDMAEKVGDVTLEGGGAAEVLKLLELDPEKLAGQDAVETFKQVADKINGLQTQADKLHVADTLFSGEGQKFLTFIQQGRAGIEAMQAEAEQFGHAVGSFDAAQIQQAQQSMQALKLAFEGFTQQLVVQAAPVLTALVDQMKGMGTTGVTATSAATASMGWLTDAIAFAGDYLEFFVDGWALLKWAGAKAISGLIWMLAKFVEGVEWLADSIPGVEVEWSKSLKKMSEDYTKWSDEIADESWDEFIGKTGGEQATQFFEGVAQKAEEAKNKIAEIPTAMDGVTSATLKMTQAIVDLEKSLDEQIKTFGMSSNAASIWKLEQEGATSEQLAGARELAAQLEQLEKDKALKDEAKDIVKDMMTPAEKFEEKMKKLRSMLAKNFIDPKQFEKAAKLARKELDEANKLPDDVAASAKTLGSEEAGRSIVNQLFGAGQTDPWAEQLKETRAQNGKMDEQTGLLRKIANNITGTGDTEEV